MFPRCYVHGKSLDMRAGTSVWVVARRIPLQRSLLRFLNFLELHVSWERSPDKFRKARPRLRPGSGLRGAGSGSQGRVVSSFFEDFRELLVSY